MKQSEKVIVLYEEAGDFDPVPFLSRKSIIDLMMIAYHLGQANVIQKPRTFERERFIATDLETLKREHLAEFLETYIRGKYGLRSCNTRI